MNKILQIGTSVSHPLIVNIIPQESLVNLKGSLGITFAPGKCHYGVKSNIKWERDLDIDLKRLKKEYNTTHIVTLIEKFEFIDLKIPKLRNKIFEHKMNSIWFPIKDGSIPDLGEETLAKFDVLISYLHSLLKTENMVVHCMGGLGRAGTIASCILIKNGEGYKEAIELVRETRKGAVETKIQEEFIKDYDDYLKKIYED